MVFNNGIFLLSTLFLFILLLPKFNLKNPLYTGIIIEFD